ncbi:MAG: hypothetical protein WC951_05085 [Bacteroidales bacterium]|nr:hypothetical protein [Tenuifilaceae bacterium]
MKKIIFITLLTFTAIIFGCESDLQNIDKTIKVTENTVSANEYLKLLEQNPNLKEVLSFLDASSIGDIDASFAEKSDDATTKDFTNYPEYIYLTPKHNPINKSSEEQKLVALILSPEKDNLKLSSATSKTEINGIGSIESIMYGNDESTEGMILMEYDLEKEFFSFSMDGFNSKRGCFDQCMYDKMKKIEDGNWVEQAAFLVGVPASVAWMAGSCVWSCR